MSMTLIVGAGVISFLLLYLAHSMNEKEHFAWRLIAYSITILLFIIIAKGSIDSTTTCENLLNNTVVNATTNTTTYEYSQMCYSNTDSTTPVTFYRLIMGVITLYFGYIFIFFIWKLFKSASNFVRKR